MNSEVYPMFGRPVPNIKHLKNWPVVVPHIEQDVLMYAMNGDSSSEAMKMIEELPEAVDNIFKAIECHPDTLNEHLRYFDNYVKSLFHLLEVCRESEALAVLEILANRRISQKKQLLDNIESAISDASDIISPR